MTDLFAQPDDATPLSAEEKEGLLPTWVTTRADLNEAEQDNIDAAVAWMTPPAMGIYVSNASS
jgi:fido (protein-threonine AMPylation protein)